MGVSKASDDRRVFFAGENNSAPFAQGHPPCRSHVLKYDGSLWSPPPAVAGSTLRYRGLLQRRDAARDSTELQSLAERSEASTWHHRIVLSSPIVRTESGRSRQRNGRNSENFRSSS